MPDSLETLRTDLAATRAAIRAILEGGQEIEIGGRTLTRASLKDLQAREALLLQQIAAVKGRKRPGGGFRRGEVSY